MISCELLKEIESLQLRAKYLASDVLCGQYASLFKGVGIEIDQVREYVINDDIRHIDWKVSARTGETHVKVFREERELTLMIVLDLSASLVFGSTKRFKHEAAAELAVILSYLAIKNNDKVGLIIFSNQIEEYIPPQKGKAHIAHIARAILSFDRSKAKRGTDSGPLIDFLLRTLAKRSLVFLISDFFSFSFPKSFNTLALKHELNCVRVEDTREFQVPRGLGTVEVIDAETGESLWVDTSSSEFSENLRTISEYLRTSLEKFCRRKGIGYFRFNTEEGAMRPLIRFLARDSKRGK